MANTLALLEETGTAPKLWLLRKMPVGWVGGKESQRLQEVATVTAPR